ncbi:TetR/AcrR family transcriptional regulator [Streptomyces litchfieldiae]|uniref:TetR/AcrR family transcriptional regulator n=1 Tax=Streptomyces litchfieldiae TaxID=3075543 RepID=A0ABU2MZ67_9ACTN|nr:TetR/AcrR family transcriptional regulator [Streptomyces sp. DSM 44938]MDT0346825.1 TetR/AcrR family transcriptional regulator [Streptomyces sp. DSM 44938]
MAAERGGLRDLEVMVDLLWRTHRPGTRGPRGSLSVDRIVAAAIEIADAEGLGGVSMRKVAERLGVTTMSLYRYVPRKDDLLDLMFEAASGQPDTTDWPDDWRGRLTAYASGCRKLFLRRPWMLDIGISGPPMGPNNLMWMEVVLASLVDTGLDEGDMVGVLMILSGYAMNEARQEVSMRRAAPLTGVTYEEWGEVYGKMLARVVDDGRYPTVARVVRSGAFDAGSGNADEDFAYGVGFILDGVAALIRERGGSDTAQAVRDPQGAGERPAGR